jgi:hypothetical protein
MSKGVREDGNGERRNAVAGEGVGRDFFVVLGMTLMIWRKFLMKRAGLPRSDMAFSTTENLR